MESQIETGVRRMTVTRPAIFGFYVVAMVSCFALAACHRGETQQSSSQQSQPLRFGEFGRAVAEGQPARNIQTFDTLDFDVFSNQKWDRLSESHAGDIIVSWPDGHDTHGIHRHIEDLKKLFVHAPDTAIKVHPVRIANGDWTAVTGIMTGTFTRPMQMSDGTIIQPTGKKFSLPMATIGHWKNGKMDHEWLYWDNATYMAQLGIGK
jgi:predicted ester cyclase